MEAVLDDLEVKLIERGAKSDTTAAIFMLKSNRRETYGDRVAHTGNDDGPLSITITRVTKVVNE